MGSPVRAGTGKSQRGQELSTFLRARRARVTPEEAGLPAGGRRRTPGLRREEVAVLAGVGASWYQWLEQGRDITVSSQVLDAVAHVLRMNSAELRHLYVLSGLNPPPPSSEHDKDWLCEGMQRLMDGWLPNPAHIMDAYWNAIGLNESASLVLGIAEQDNCLLSFFLDETYRSRARNWQVNAPNLVAELRASLTGWPEDEGFRLLFAELTERSEEFRTLWAQGDVRPSGQLRKELDNPVVGALVFETTTLQVPARPDLRLVLHNPYPGTGTQEKLEQLMTPEVRRASIRRVAG